MSTPTRFSVRQVRACTILFVVTATLFFVCQPFSVALTLGDSSAPPPVAEPAALPVPTSILGKIVKTDASPEADRLKKAGDDALALGNYANAQWLYTDALKALGKGDAVKESAIRDALAQAFFFQGKLKESRSEISRALSLATKKIGQDSLEAARELDGMAWLLEGEGKVAKAKDYAEQALSIRQAKLPANSPDLADSLEHAGWLSENKGVYSDAERYYKQALGIRQETSGKTSMVAADILERLGVVARLNGNVTEAQSLFKEALDIKEPTGAEFRPYAPQALDKRVVFRFSQGAPNCQTSSSGGTWTQRVTASGVSVEASFASRPSEFVKTKQARIVVSNNSGQNIFLLSQPPVLMALAPKVQPAKYLDAEQLAQTIQDKGERKATKVWKSGKDATTAIFSTVNEANPLWRRTWTPFGYAPVADGWTNNTRTVTTLVPDMEARAQAAQKAAEISSKSKAEAATTRREALGPTAVAPGTVNGGVCDFDCGDFDRAVLRIPVGDAVFEFHFDSKKPW